ncbi:MAG: GNAT family N-acetyltransferase [Actinomycetota bacterium]
MNKKIKIVEIKKFNYQLVEKLKALEVSSFGPEAAANQWLLPVIIRYGKIIAVKAGSSFIGLCLLIRSWDNTDTAFIYSLHVKKQYRNQGIGKMLLAKAIEISKDYGIKCINLTVSPENKTAIKLYKNFGFKINRLKKNEYGKGVHRYLMSLKF